MARRQTVRDRLHSIAHDATFVQSIAALIPLPVVANLRAGPWYCAHAHATAYFKSTDGHYGEWQLSMARLNAHLLPLLVEEGGALLVDVTRRGRRCG